MLHLVLALTGFAALTLPLISSPVQGRTTESPLDKLQGPIFISEPPSSLAFANTKGALVPCTAFGRPAPVLDWIKDDGTPVENIDGILQILPNNTLHFLSFEPSKFMTNIHSQTYRCTAYNEAGNVISRSMRVKAVLVEDYRSYNLQLSDVWAQRSSTAVFRCVINPSFVKDYIKVVSWTQGTKPIYPGERVSLLSDGELHIRDIRDEDRYTTYRCLARNILTGEEKSSDFAYLHVHDPPAGWTVPSMDDTAQSLTVEEGGNAELPCVGSSNPLPTYRWMKDGRTVHIDNTHFKQNGGNLLVISARVSDSGHYVCNVSNSHGAVTALTEFIVTSSLSAIIDPPSQMIDSGQSAAFNCSVSGHPIESITWFKNGQPLEKNLRYSFQSETILQIDDINRPDQGMYQCVVSNDKENSQATAQLLLGAAHPSFIDQFVDQYVQTGQRTSLRCSATGNPSPNITWTLDGDVIPEDSNIRVGSSITTLGDVVSYVNISSIKIPLGGEYRCMAGNEVGEIEHTGRVNVYGIPYVRPMKNVTATANEQLSIRCYVAGYPVTSITWSKNDHTLPQNHLQKVINGTLTIEKVQKHHDTGEYVCTAKNADGQGMKRSVFISVLEPPVIDPFHFPRKKQGDRIVVSCVVSSGDQPLDIHWLKDGQDIPPDMGIMIQKLGTFTSMLQIGDASPRHNGNYTCMASNAASSINFTSPLHVDVPPRWVIEPADQFVILQHTVSLDCLTAGTPEPLITWKKARGNRPGNYRLIDYITDDGDTTEHLQLLSNGTLIIRDAAEEDHGYYLCHSTNGVGLGLSKVIFLTVHIPARFDAPSKNYTVRKGQNITMDCQAIGDKPLSLTWSFNGQTLIAITKNRREIQTINTNRGKLSQLSLHPSVREDTGFYVCTAKNKFGAGALSMRLTVLEPPEPPANITLVKVDSRNLTLTWHKPYNGNSDLLNYIIEYKIHTAVWQGLLPNISVPATQLKATISKLHPAYTYNVRVRANNSIGYSQPSIVLNASMDEEAPSGSPEDVIVKAIGSETLKISWMPPKEENRNGVIKGYYIGYKETSSPSRFIYITKVVEGEFVPELLLQNLEKFTEYTVHVQAYNARGRGPSSPDVKVYTLEDVPSQPPKDVQATSLNSQSIKVLWSPPPRFTLHGILQGYKIIYKPVRHDEDESDADTVTTNELGWTLTGLAKFTNYSLQVLAYTRKGEGVRSSPKYVRTMQDKPERPADIKALPVNSTSILVAWKPPLHKNGYLTKYNLFYQNLSKGATEQKLEIHVPPSLSNYRFGNLSVHMGYKFRISASTFIGEGEKTHIAKASPLDKVPARIASFSEVMTVPWQHTVKLPCLAVGNPEPSVTWKVRGKVLSTTDRIKILTNGSLHIEAITGSDAANYTCRSTNTYGSDEIVYAISVQAPPRPPRLYVVASTSSTIQVNWRSGSNGGSPIQGFELQYKKEHEAWRKIKAGSSNRTYTAMGLLCGTSYKFYINAFNVLGSSPNTEIISAKTNGSTPIMPAQSKILKAINVTHVDLDMSSWQTSGCPIRFFSIKYQVWDDDKWIEVANNINKNISTFTVLDLHPATWYKMKVTAHSDAGSTECQLKFATLTYHGSTITPIIVAHKLDSHFYDKPYVMIPLCAGIVTISVILVGVFLYCKRRREILRLKEISSNLRRDITAETSLMNDLDKRLNLDLDSSSGNSELFGKRNVNLLISLNSDDNIHGNSQSWLIHDNSKTNSDNLSFGRSDDDGNINPYATFNELKEVFAESHEVNRSEQRSPDFDEISLEKAQAQKAMLTPSEPYVPFFQTKGDKSDVLKESHPLEVTHDAQSRLQGYDNQGLVLSPRKYASADQIHALFTQAPPRPHSTYGKSKSGSHGSSDEKGSQRHSLISSVTTVSSSRDELLEALENAKRNPPPPVVYESPPESSSQPTDSSGTEPGIVQFTQSPPKPNEQREAACELPAYNVADKSKRPRKLEPASDSTECETTEVAREVPQPRKRGRHRGKQRGHISVKRQLLPSIVPRTLSRTSTTSSEEVTYTFGGRDSPHSNSPSEGYLSYPQDSQGYSESDYSTQRPVGGRRTPHARARYSTSLQTPGTDENKPLVRSIVQPTMTSPAEEDEDSVSLLDRYYRPVEETEGQSTGITLKSGDKGYTEDFTIV